MRLLQTHLLRSCSVPKADLQDIKDQGIHAGAAAKASQKWRPLPIGPALMSSIAKASGAVSKLHAVRGSSEELPASAQPDATALGLSAAACEETPLPSQHGLKRRRHSDETQRASVKQPAAGVLLYLKCAPKVATTWP